MPVKLSEVILEPIVTEKGSSLRERGVYLVKVLPGSNKILIKQAAEKFFSVKVDSVRVVNQKAKVKKSLMRRGSVSRKASFKKAYIKLKGDSKISQFEV